MQSLPAKGLTDTHSTYYIVEAAAPPPKDSTVALLAPALPTIALSLFGIVAVHRLTRGREREKALFDQHKLLQEQASYLRTAAKTGWAAPKRADRLVAINETKWRLQQLGATAERIRVLSKRASWKFGIPPRRTVSISMREEMALLRKRLTDDPFEDPKRGARAAEAMQAEDEIGLFLAGLEPKIRVWLAPNDQ